jgi:hypothetical protein
LRKQPTQRGQQQQQQQRPLCSSLFLPLAYPALLISHHSTMNKIHYHAMWKKQQIQTQTQTDNILSSLSIHPNFFTL